MSWTAEDGLMCAIREMQDHAAELRKLVREHFTTTKAVDGHYVNSLLLQLDELAEELDKVAFTCLEVVPPPSPDNDGPSITPEEEALAVELDRVSSLEHKTIQDLFEEIEQVRLNMSRKMEGDRLNDATAEYEVIVGTKFKFLHCWYLLRGESKWQDALSALLEDRKGKGKASASTTAAPSETVGSVEGRPIGRDRAKKLRSGDGGDSSSSTCLEVLQQLTISREADTEARDAKLDDLLQVEAKKIKLKEEHILVQREAIEV
ncbi:hypothetical protein BAE44_0003690 [Dichanthelium oligosanthes]|uniref:No apical meristem-associated C-terminal domain-containing protein n=1 Tax=Dichanthelium oligosanthes TaxID=888268 RepID=A0A1E5WD50_9POAL|nr:hypothetical protein BAE44_0003690 [Dichanthelium oligosanthes]